MELDVIPQLTVGISDFLKMAPIDNVFFQGLNCPVFTRICETNLSISGWSKGSTLGHFALLHHRHHLQDQQQHHPQRLLLRVGHNGQSLHLVWGLENMDIGTEKESVQMVQESRVED